MKKIFCTLPFLLFAFCLFAQTTGSFQITVDFNEPDYTATRTLYYFVPTDYDETQSYKLVVGFRGGPHTNAGQFRDQLAFLADSIGAIILCPENADHFWMDEGLTKPLFNYSLDTTMAVYNIDPDFVYLTGLSYGGRHAVIVSMDSDAGPIPKLRGVIPFAAGSEADTQPNYEDISDFPPACICIGLDDTQNFINVSNNLRDDIVSAGGYALLNEIPGVGHTVAFPTFPSEMMECFNYIESNYEVVSTTKEAAEEDDNGISVFPNPASDTVELLIAEELLPTKIIIVDMSSTVVKEVSLGDMILDLSDLVSGEYTLIVVSGTRMITEKFTIVR